tara:strand:+ start:132 stop:2696 length:2565 start_codon:yes stop_codon:yes gene_type:complete
MALVLKDRVKETTTTTGTGTITLTGAVVGYQTFSVIGNSNTTYYVIEDANNAWEVGIGTYTLSGTTLARTTILANSSGDTSAITLSSGTHTVFCTYPAGKSVNLDASGALSPEITVVGTISSGDWEATDVAVAHGGTGSSTAGGARTNLGVAIGSDVQGYDADLAAIAALASSDSNFIVGSAGGWVVESGATVRTSLGAQATITFGTGVETFLGTPSSANLATAITDETGSGLLVFATSPTLVTPVLGTPASGTLTNCTFPTLNQSTSGTAAIATTVTVADESSDSTCFPLFVTAATGNVGPKSGTNLTFASDTGILTATGFAGPLTGNVTGDASGSSGSCTGNAATVTTNANLTGHITSTGNAAILGSFTVAQLSTALSDASISGSNTGDQTTVSGSSGSCTGNAATATLATDATSITVSANDSTDETVYPLFVDGATGSQGAETDTGLTYNPSSGLLTSTLFAGALTGNVTGNASGTAATVTGGTQAAITSAANLVTIGTVTSGTLSTGTVLAGVTVTMGSDAEGDIYYRNASGVLTRLAASTDGHVLTATGAGSAPAWEAATGGIPTAITVADESTDTTCFPLFVTAATGNLGPKSGSNLTFNSSTGVLTATGFAGPLTGNVTGNASGTALTVTQAAQSAITSVGTLTALTVDNIIIDGTTIGHTSDGDLMTLVSGGLTLAGTLTVGVNDTGHDVKLFGATSGSYLEWDESEDRLNLVGGSYVQEAVPANDTPTASSARTLTFDLSTGNYQNQSLPSNSSVGTVNKIIFANAKRGQRFIIRLTQHASSANTVSWADVDSDASNTAATVRWAGNITPTMSTATAHTDVYGFLCTNDAGTTFDGFIIGQDLPD